MLALAALNVLGVCLFGGIYAAAGLGHLAQGAFGVALAGSFVLMTVLWLRVEGRRPADLDGVRRVGRAALGLVVTVIVVPTAVILPLSALELALPAEVRGALRLPAVMFLLLVALALVVLVNAVGAIAVVGAALGRRLRRARARS